MGEDDRWIAGLLIQEAEARRRDASKKEGRIPVNTEFLQRSISTTNHRDLKAAAAGSKSHIKFLLILTLYSSDLKRTAAETAFDLKARELRERRSGGSPQPSCKKRRYIPPSRGDSGASTDHRRGESPDVVVDLTKEYNWVKPGLVVRVRDKASEHFRQKMVVKECAKDVCTGKIIASGANASIEIRQVETVVSKSPGR